MSKCARRANRSYFRFTPKDHADLGEALGQMDFAAAAKLTGARFVVLRVTWHGCIAL